MLPLPEGVAAHHPRTKQQTGTMSTVYLHIGYPKTGTTYMQAVLRKNAARLGDHGIAYPLYDKRQLTDSTITSGNGNFLIEDAARRQKFLKEQDPRRHLLISSERLSVEIARTDNLGDLIADLKRMGYDRFKVLLLLRNPIEYAASSFQQGIKRGGRTNDIAAHFDEFSLGGLLLSLKKLEAAEGLELRILNYGNWRDRLSEVLRDWLELPFDLEPPQTRTINRGLTASELNLQRMLNARLGSAGNVLADRFCEDLPDVAAETQYPPLDVQQRLAERMGPVLEKINRRLPAGEKLEFAFMEPTPVPEGNHFSDAQLEIIAEAIAKRELMLRERVPQIVHQDPWTKVLERDIRLGLKRFWSALFSR